MDQAQFAQLKAMSPVQRLGYYFKKLASGEISREQYDMARKFIATLPNTTVDEEGDLVGTSSGESDTGAIGYSEVGDGPPKEGSESVEDAPREDAPITSMESVSALSLPGDSDVTAIRAIRGEIIPKTQKERLLNLLNDGNWHATPEIQQVVYGANHLGVARVAAICQDLKDDGYTIESQKIGGAIWAYRLVDANVRYISQNIAAG